jgi:hypothetical protein
MFRIKMIRQKHRMLILLSTTLLFVLFCLPFRAVVSFSGGSPSPHSQFKHTTCIRSSSGFFGTSYIDRRQFSHKAKAGNEDDEFDDDYYYPPTPRSAGTSPMPSSPRPPRRPKSRDNTDVNYDDYYYEDEEANLPFSEPLRTNNEETQKLARYQSRQDVDDDDDDDYEDDEDYYYDDDEEEDDYDSEEEDEETSSLGGNFWSNPTSGIDRSKRPPSPPSPRVTRPRRRQEDSYDPRSRRRRR